MEVLILREPWRDLFSDKEREVAIARLQTYSYVFDHGEITMITENNKANYMKVMFGETSSE